MRKLTIRQVEAFQAVMKLGAMTKAAEFLQISQPAVSRLMADLQAVVGFTLFKRTRHGAIPTADAERLLSEVRNVFVGLDELNRRVRAIRHLEVGELRIGAVSLYGNGLLPQIVAAFVEQHPGVSVTLEIDAHERIVDWLHSRRCDLGFVSLPAQSGDLTVHLLAAQPALCVMPAGHPLAAKTTIQAADLAGLPFISFLRDTPTRFQIDSVFDRFDIARDTRVEASTHEAVFNFVAAGVGVSIISPFTPHLSRNAAVAFRPFQPPLIREIGLLVNDEHLSTLAGAFRDFVIAHFRSHAAGKPAPAA